MEVATDLGRSVQEASNIASSASERETTVIVLANLTGHETQVVAMVNGFLSPRYRC